MAGPLLGPDILQRAACVLGPRKNLVIILSVTDTVSLFKTPQIMKGRFCAFMMAGADADIVFGDSGVVCVYGQASTVDNTTREITVNAGSGGHLKDGVKDTWIVSNDDAHDYFSVDCVGAGSGKLYITVTSP